MDAFFARNRLSAYLDGDLSDEESAEVGAALDRDPELRAELEAMRSAVDLLRELGPTRAPPGFEARVMARVEAEGGGGVLVRLRGYARRLPVEALALAAAAAVVVIVIQGRPDDSGERSAAPGEGAEVEPILQAAAPKVAPAPDAAGADAAEVAARPSAAERVEQAPRRAAPTAPTPGAVGEVYVPDWEREDELQQADVVAMEAPDAASPAGDPAEAPSAAPEPTGPAFLGFQLTVTDPGVLYQLVNLTEGLGGQAFDRRGRPTRGAQLTEEENFTSLRLLVPAANGPALQRQLGGLGARAAAPPSGLGAVNAEQMGFVVEVSYNP